ncbi:MAG: hypothetical protein KatS3mg012_1489 [Gaiellaceae bacterium]|nr:MAG: hypothetical protein KatS3mg012_1489 [Gaiellaceae bacterium]
MARDGRIAWGALAAGIASVLALPIAIYLTRFSDAYELLHASVAIPVAGLLGVAAISLAARAQRRSPALLRTRAGVRGAMLARVLGVVGVCLAASALVALGVYGLLEYAGTR